MTDTTANKRQRTYEIVDNRVTVNVGGKLFSTFRSTLTIKSTYFSKRLSGRFSDADDREIIIDRDHEPFSIMLSYLRSGKLLISSGKLLFRSVLIEADFYGIDEIVNMVRDKCFCNLNHIDVDEYDEGYLKECKEAFPTYEQIIDHAFFPAIYFNSVNYYRILSTQILPSNKYVRVRQLDNKSEYIGISQSITYECLQTNTVYIEPLVSLNYCPSWLSIKAPTSWRTTTNNQCIYNQLVPISFWLGFQSEEYKSEWYIATKSTINPNTGDFQFTARINGKPEAEDATMVEVYIDDCIEHYMHTKLYGYSPVGNVVEVTKASNFMHRGPVTDDDE